MQFTVQLSYQGGPSTVVSIDADSADQALEEVRDQRRLLVQISITAPSQQVGDAVVETSPTTFTSRRVPVPHRPSRRHH